MKLSDFIANYLKRIGVQHVFVVQGGAVLHLIDSVDKLKGINNVPMQHEQAAAMAADAYAKVSPSIGCTFATSGPGATNLITGIACSYFDSIPTLHITGNVSSFRQSDSLNVRQYGFQETNIVEMVKPICKHAERLCSPEDIFWLLPKLFKIAIEGRKGPVLLDVPDDFQRVVLDNIKCKEVLNQIKPKAILNCRDYTYFKSNLCHSNAFEWLVDKLRNKKKCIVILGAGLKSRQAQAQAVAFCQKYGLAYLSTWPLKGISDSDDHLNLGTFGTHSLRGNNIVLQSSDFILSIGCRLDSRATGKLDLFAPNASVCMVDIDYFEMEKFKKLNFSIDKCFHLDAESFITMLGEHLGDNIDLRNQEWSEYIDYVRRKYNFLPDYNIEMVNPYKAVEVLSDYFSNEQMIVVDTGTCLPLTLVYAKEKRGQKYISSYNNTPMGYALPAAVGVAQLQLGSVVCMCGDGGMQMNIQELATISKQQLPILIVVFNNHGHSMIMQTQDDWLDSNYSASSNESGLPDIQFSEIASAYKIESLHVRSIVELVSLAPSIFPITKPLLVEFDISSKFRCEPIIKYGEPLEFMSPIVNRDEINKDMNLLKGTS
ncbi:thiamine pyrophosphate-binding protein [Catenovulum sediminis]|uniref:Thiamine pyrophosphate-binding protein n=1 Tax=Catenovulum sediminis TaxID=1740262 RepID=A0ABV1RHK1_9ALTE